MMHFGIHYRWSGLGVRKNLLGHLRWWRTGLANILRYAPVVWEDGDWDWEFAAALMLYKLRRLSADTEGRIAPKQSQRMRQAIFCLDRVCRDEYCTDKPNEFNRKVNPSWVTQDQRDFEYAFRLMAKHMQRWWT